MKNIQEIHHRKSIRLPEYDYSQPGAYFVTICAHNRECLFGDIAKDVKILNRFGNIVEEEWKRSETIRSEIQLDEFTVMPNHLHGIVWIINTHSVGATVRSPHHIPNKFISKRERSPLHTSRGPKPKSLSSFIAGFKSICKTRINKIRNTPGKPVWQRNYHEHIIRNENELNKIREYILNNHLKWETDRNHPDNIPTRSRVIPTIKRKWT
jgi:putative transposase